MKNFTMLTILIFILAIINKTSGQNYFERCFSFETNDSQIIIDSTSIWSIGQPNTETLNSSYNSINSIVTNLDTNYMNLDSSYFYLEYGEEEWENGMPNYLESFNPIIFEFDHRFVMDSIFDHGKISISADNGETWFNILDSIYLANCGGCNYSYHYSENTNETSFYNIDILGDSNGWIHSTFELNIEALTWNNGNVYIPTKIAFKFEIISDIVNTNEGWQIDNICFHYDYPNTIQEHKISKLSVFPNPNTGVFQLANVKGNGLLDIYTSVGKKVYSNNIKATEDINTSLSSGIYKVHFIQDNSLFQSIIIIK